MPLASFAAFEAVAIALWLTKGNVFHLFNFTYQPGKGDGEDPLRSLRGLARVRGGTCHSARPMDVDMLDE